MRGEAKVKKVEKKDDFFPSRAVNDRNDAIRELVCRVNVPAKRG